MAIRVGELFVRLGIDLSGLTRGLSAAEARLESTERELNRSAKTFGAFSKIGQGMTLAGAGVAAGLGLAVKSAADFEQGLSNIKAVSGATADEMGQLRNLAMKMGADTKYSATQAAQGIEELIKAGVSTKDILGGGLEGALSLATAGELELGDAAEIASTALNAFKKDGLKVVDAANILAGAANASATNVEELKFGLSMASAVASGTGMSFKDTATALAVFAQSGLKGSDAGTSLKTMLLNLQSNSDKAAAAMQRLGIETKKGDNVFYDAKGNVKSLAEISQVLHEKLKNLTSAERQAELKQMFGTDAIRAANILFETGAAGVNKMQKEMSKVTAAQVAAEKMNNLKGSIEQLKGATETAAISIGTALIPVVKDIAKGVTSLVDKFNELSPSTQSSIATFAALSAGILLIGGPILMLIGFIPTIISGFAMIGTVAGVMWTAITGPVGLVIAAIIAVIAIGVLLYKNWDVIKAKSIVIWNSIKSYLSVAWSGIKTAASSAWEGLKSIIKSGWDFIKNTSSSVWGGIKSIILGIWGVIVSGIKGYINIIISGINIMIRAINSISFKAPDWVPGIGGKGWSPNIRSIPKLAEGGIVNRPTLALIGEAGPEAVVPLKKMGSQGTTNIFNLYGTTIREEADIEKVAKRLKKLQDSRMRPLGV